MIRRGLGWIPDDIDERDAILASAHLPGFGASPATSVVRDDLLPPEVADQGPDATCVAEAGAAVIYGAHVASDDVSPPYELLSSKGAHWLCRHELGSHHLNVGTRNRTFFRVLNKRGFCRARHWPHDRPLTQRPDVEAGRMMIDQRDRKAELGAVRYERIGDTGLALLYAIRSALMADMLIQAGFYVGESFHAYRPGQVLDPPSDGGGHAMVIYGYDNGRWLLRNSHGERYGDAGNLMISDAYMMTARDPWVARSAPPFSDTP